MEILPLPLPTDKHSKAEPSTALQSLSQLSRVGKDNIASERTRREHRLHQLFYCCVMSPRSCMLRALRSNGCKRNVS
jgi:hypothetical protein